MKEDLQKRVLELSKQDKTRSEIQEILKKEKFKTRLGTVPSAGYIGSIISGGKNKHPRRKKDIPTLVHVPLESPEQVCIVFGSSEKVERALGILRDIYQSGR